MIKLRNMVCHSQYPDFDHFRDEIDGSGFNQLATYSANDKTIREHSIIVQLEKLAVGYYEEAVKLLQ